MRTRSRVLIALPACSSGGGGRTGKGGGSTGSAPPATGAPATGAPTTANASDPGSASARANAAIRGANPLVQACGASGLPLGVLVSPYSGLQSTRPTACPNGGAVTTTIDTAGSSGISAHDTAPRTCASCAKATRHVMNRSPRRRHDRGVGATDCAMPVTMINFTVPYGGRSWGVYSDTGGCAYANGSTTTCTVTRQ